MAIRIARHRRARHADNAGAGAGEAVGQARADAPRRAGHQGDLALQREQPGQRGAYHWMSDSGVEDNLPSGEITVLTVGPRDSARSMIRSTKIGAASASRAGNRASRA